MLGKSERLGVLSGVSPIFAGSDPDPALVALGLTSHNGSRYLRPTLESILAQEFKDFALVILDDCSDDDSPAILEEIATRHKNVLAYRHHSRGGMVRTWVDVFQLSRIVAPQQKYFAWCSDHDLLRKGWLGALVEELDAHADAVLAYSFTEPIDRDGQPFAESKQADSFRFETRGCQDPIGRFYLANRRAKGIGNITYGLVRSEALSRVGIYRNVLKPDRLAVLELSLQGEILEVPEVLRLRRMTSTFSLARQRATLFEPGKRPLSTYLPWPAVHAAALFSNYFDKSRRPANVNTIAIGLMSFDLVYWQIKRSASGYPTRLVKIWRRAMKRWRRAIKSFASGHHKKMKSWRRAIKRRAFRYRKRIVKRWRRIIVT